MNFPGGWELVLIVLVIVLLFGARKLPEAARGLGRSLRIFKSEVTEAKDGEPTDSTAAAPQQPAPPPAIAPPVQTYQPPVQAYQPPVQQQPVQAPQQVPVPPAQQAPAVPPLQQPVAPPDDPR